MNNIKRATFDAGEVGSFLYSAIHGITGGKADCDGKNVYLEGKPLEWMKSEKPFPIPLFMHIINLGTQEEKTKVLSELSNVLGEDSERIKQYLKTITPFFRFEDSETHYLITEEGVITTPMDEIVSSSKLELDSHFGLWDDEISKYIAPTLEMAIDTYGAVLRANHHRFFKRFCPWYFEGFNYAPIRDDQKVLIKEYAKSIKETNPLSSKELSDLVQ